MIYLDISSKSESDELQLQEDLASHGFELPGINLFTPKQFVNERDLEEEISDSSEMADSSNVQNTPSKGAPSDEQIDPSNVNASSNSPSKGPSSLSEEQNTPSEGLNSSLYIQRLQSEIKNREHTQRTCAQEKFLDSENLNADKSASETSVAQDMVRLWEQHVVQTLTPANWRGTLHLTEERKGQLESLFKFHFQNDIRLWERFCLRVKASNFLMGGGPSGWPVTLDWILSKGNLLKVLEGNYDGSKRAEAQDSCDWMVPSIQPNPIRDAEKAAIISTIKDPVWKNWCSQLVEGVRYNETKMLHEPLPIGDLRLIANARFLECESERLVWVGSSEQRILNKIEDLRLKINWVFEKEYPKARTFRTRLVSAYSSHPSPIEGDHHD